MTATSHNLSLFGINLAELFHRWRAHMLEALNRPALAWLGIHEAVRVIHPDRSTSCYRAFQPCPQHQAARFSALLLPEDMTLHRSLALPTLNPHDLHAALSLEVESLSPFPAEQTLWGYRRLHEPGGTGDILLAITSRGFVERHRAGMRDLLPEDGVEIWAATPLGPVPLGGETETPRHLSQRRNIRLAALTLLTLAALLIALAALPVAVSHHQRSQAETAYQQLRQETQPLLETRDRLTRAQTLVADLQAEQAMYPDILPVLEALSAAIPDDAWLERMEWQGTTLQISGLADNGTALLNQLSALPLLAEVRSSAPITRDPRQDKDRFTLDIKLPQPETAP